MENTQMKVETIRLVHDTSKNLFSEFQKENLDKKVSFSTFGKALKHLNCKQAVGEIDGCSICLQNSEIPTEEEIFVKKEHKDLVKKCSRGIKTVSSHLPRGFLL
jgi:hypothetical protein